MLQQMIEKLLPKKVELELNPTVSTMSNVISVDYKITNHEKLEWLIRQVLEYVYGTDYETDGDMVKLTGEKIHFTIPDEIPYIVESFKLTDEKIAITLEKR